MSRYSGAVCRICRREGEKLFLKGDRCYTDKCGYTRKPTAPGFQPARGRRKVSDYGTQLREKQKLRKAFGICEKQFKKYYQIAIRKTGKTGEVFLQLLESRLDAIVYRLGFCNSRPQARQYVNHGHFMVNDKKVDIASYLVKPGDVVAVREKSRAVVSIKNRMESIDANSIKPWLKLDPAAFSGVFVKLPERSELPEEIQEHLIVEFYSR
ncbi:MAG: 30S ribosomal protein S4 [Candidatus Wallbacteria bacterium HGW-Wallbacteria-1]|jgi:small subunit ribosomal protein S4|uniref:Small ribosomal subunit protein uS4 n=1 Tax=Candidatus Wallbacteria bacterium HGW-Wallbacteria-1 TaxID=2013854 RepID=A0A2N1PSV6_9BACT|nr:MAG: 30S ribosomal protein S4 [Candidatus Wallbacteria bacterium HGW-Wallbacteria-1]